MTGLQRKGESERASVESLRYFMNCNFKLLTSIVVRFKIFF